MPIPALVSRLAGRKWTVVLVCLAAGALAGFGVARSQLSGASATVTLEIGRINSCLGRLKACDLYPIQDIVSIDGWLSSSEAARQIAGRIGHPELAGSFVAMRHGGGSALSVREKPLMPFIQIRVRADTAAIAEAAADAAARLLVEEHQKRTAESQAELKLLEDQAKEDYAYILAASNNLASIMGAALATKDIAAVPQVVLLAGVRRDLISELAQARATQQQLHLDFIGSEIRKTKITLPAAIEFSILASPLRMAGVGAAIGLLTAFLLLTLGLAPKRPEDGVAAV